MATHNFLIESQNLQFPVLEEQIRRLLLNGVDTRLTPVSRNRALLPAHLIDAIQAQYGIDPWRYLQTSGISFDRVYPISDAEALTLVSHRAVSELDAQVPIVVPDVSGVAWHLANINVPKAWTELGGPDNINWKCKVGQIDTGFTKHPALGFDQGQSPWLLTNECRNFYAPSDDSNQDPGDASGEDPCTGANGGHGTRIGATISGFHPGGDGGHTFYGCAPKVPHVVVRISNSVLINDQLNSFAEALNYLVDVARVDTVNLSMGAFPRFLTSQAKAAINNAYSNGVILVCAGGQHVPPVVAPACFGRTIAVGGTTSKDQVWAKSSRGPEIDWSVPAADIRRATTKKKDGPFVYGDNGDGTSYATALSTGVAALWLTHRHAMISAIYGKTWRRVNAFKQIAKATARVPPVWGPGVGGTGILDAYAVLAKDLPRADALTEESAI